MSACLLQSNFSLADLSQSQLSNTLGWIIQPNNPYNICGGYYKELPIIYTPSPYVSSQKQNYDFKFDQMIYSFKGASQAKGHVKITQQNTEMTSNVAYMFRHETTNTPKAIKMSGFIGKKIRLERIFNRKTQKTIIIPLDHGLSVGPIKGIDKRLGEVVNMEIGRAHV